MARTMRPPPLSAEEAAARGLKWGGYRNRWEYYAYSGDKKHVAVGLMITSVIIVVPWLYFTKGLKHSSHGDYMDKAEQARKARLSSTGANTATE